METSIVIAQFLGLIYLIVGLGIMLNKKHFKKIYKEASHDHFGMYIAGLLALVFGIFIILYHNIWVNSWVVLITVFGWVAFIKGVLIIIFPNYMSKQIKQIIKDKNLFNYSGIIAFVLGLVFTFYGFLS